MVAKTITIIVLLLVGVWGVLEGKALLPAWGYYLTICLSIILLVAYIFKIAKVLKERFEERLSEIDNKILSSHEVLESQLLNLRGLVKDESSLLHDRLSKESKSVCEAQTELSNHFDSEISLLKENQNERFTSQFEVLSSLGDSINKKSTEIRSLIVNGKNDLCDDITTALKNDSSVIKGCVEENAETAVTSITDKILSVKSFAETSFTSFLEKYYNNIESLEKAANVLFEQLKLNNSTIETKSQLLLSSTESQSKIANENVSKTVEVAVASLSENMDLAKRFTEEALGALSMAGKEQSATLQQQLNEISRQADLLQESLSASTNELSAKSDALSEALITGQKELKDGLFETAEKGNENVTTAVAGAVTSLSENLDLAKRFTEEALGALSMAGKEQSATLQQQLNEISRQADLLQESLSASTNELSAKSDALSEALITGQKELKDGLFETAEKGNENVTTAVAGAVTSLSKNLDLVKLSTLKSLEFLEKNKQNMGDLFNKIIALQSQNTGISSIINNSINNSLASKESVLKALNEKSAVLQKEINKTYFQAQNLENLISQVPTKNKEIVESIKTLIRTEIKSLISNSVSELNDEILSSQIVQESVNNELSKLQILLRTILKSFDNYSELLKDQSINNLGTESQVSDRTKLGPSNSPVRRLLNKEPNRTETIVDDESGNVVFNHYKNGDLIKTTMKDKHDRTIYELEYINGRIQRSKNYDANGKLSIEQTFHNNGQVHYRIEYTKNGKITSEFDNNGNKK